MLEVFYKNHGTVRLVQGLSMSGGGAAPTLTSLDMIIFTKAFNNLYGSHVGDLA